MTKKWITGLFVLFLLAGFLLPILLPDRTFSELENRNLAQKPVFSLDRLMDGRYASDVESYLNDQFVARDLLVRVSASTQALIGLRERGGAYLGTDGVLLEKVVLTPTELENADRNAQAVKAFAQRMDIPVDLALIPSAASIYPERLPSGAPSDDQSAAIRALYELAGGGLDVEGTLLAHKDESVYYATDHHLTSLGSYRLYQCLLPALTGGEAKPLERYTPQTLSTDFYGTLYSKAPRFWVKPDEIVAYAPSDGVTVSAFDGSQETTGGLYHTEKLETKDQYAVFLGGNQPLVVIRSENAPEGRLLIVRDSYADSLVPFLTADYAEIHLIDPRYYRQSVAQYAKEHQIDRVLVMMSLVSFSQSPSPGYVLGL